jgi:hypothetical protein
MAVKERLSEIAKKYGIAEDVVGQLLGNEGLVRELESDLVPLPTFKSELEKQKNGYESKLTDFQSQVSKWQEWYDNTLTPDYTSLQQRVQQYEEQLAGAQQRMDGRVEMPTGEVITKNEFDARLQAELQRREQAFIEFWHTTSAIQQKHQQEFGEPLDTKALEKYALENRMPSIDIAYDKMMESRRTEKQQKEWSEREKTLRAEIEQDMRSRYSIPDEGDIAGSPLSIAAESSGDYGFAEFQKDWRAAQDKKDGQKI